MTDDLITALQKSIARARRASAKARFDAAERAYQNRNAPGVDRDTVVAEYVAADRAYRARLDESED